MFTDGCWWPPQSTTTSKTESPADVTVPALSVLGPTTYKSRQTGDKQEWEKVLLSSSYSSMRSQKQQPPPDDVHFAFFPLLKHEHSPPTSPHTSSLSQASVSSSGRLSMWQKSRHLEALMLNQSDRVMGRGGGWRKKTPSNIAVSFPLQLFVQPDKACRLVYPFLTKSTVDTSINKAVSLKNNLSWRRWCYDVFSGWVSKGSNSRGWWKDLRLP